jgi:hypothetical protein
MIHGKSQHNVPGEVSAYLRTFKVHVEEGNWVQLNVEALKTYERSLSDAGSLWHAAKLTESGADMLLGNGFYDEAHDLYRIAALRYFGLAFKESRMDGNFIDASALFDRSARIYGGILGDEKMYLTAMQASAECLTEEAKAGSSILSVMLLDRAAEYYRRIGDVEHYAECALESGLMRNDIIEEKRD